MRYWMIDQGRLRHMVVLPPGMTLFTETPVAQLEAAAEPMHRNLRAWAEERCTPGPLTPDRVYVGAAGQVAFGVPDDAEPAPLMVNVGASPDLAGWLVLLDKRMATAALLESARRVWSPADLAGALPFVTPAFLPPALVLTPPDNWVRVARALAALLVLPAR